MGSTVSKFQFSSSSAAEAAFDRIRNELITGIERHSDVLYIYSDCQDVAKAAQICQANGGRAC